MPVFESSRKVQRFGSSLAMTLPSMFVKVNEIEKGSEMNVHFGLNGTLVMSNCDDDEVLIDCLMKMLVELEKKAHAGSG